MNIPLFALMQCTDISIATYSSIDFVDDDAIRLLGSQDSLHLAGVGDAGVQSGAGAIVASVYFYRPVAAVSRHYVRQRCLTQPCMERLVKQAAHRIWSS